MWKHLAKMFKLRGFIVCVVLSFIIATITADNDYKVVDTKNGQVRGLKKSTLLKNVTYYSFKGIPYAKPPIGDLRFKAPEPVESWAPTVLDTFEHGNVCMAHGLFELRPLPQSEDCLTMNIYVPANINEDEKLAVLFFIHGGAFVDGSSDDVLLGPDFIVEKRTILVTFNYRLGVLGFLSLDTPEYSGNMGLKDQQLALKWISENIQRFGGDNKRITVFGNSAGGASTHYQVLSAESRQYFRNAIPMSGTVDVFWAFSSDDHLKRAFNIAEQLGEPKTTHEELISFLKSVPAKKLCPFSPLEQGVMFRIPVGPIAERKDAIRPFLVESPIQVLKTSAIETDVMFTLTSQETISLVPKPNSAIFKYFNDNFNTNPLPFRELDIPVDSKEHSKMMKDVRRFYFGDSSVGEKTMSKLYDYFSDVNFVVGTDRSVKLHATHGKGKTFYAWFSVDSTLNIFKNAEIETVKGVVKPDLPGAAHADEICYLFRCDIAEEFYKKVINNPSDEQSKISLQTIDHLTTLFTNFAKYGDPSYQNNPIEGFRPVQSNEIHYLHISNDGLKTDVQPRKEAIQLWEKIEQQATKANNKFTKSSTRREEL